MPSCYVPFLDCWDLISEGSTLLFNTISVSMPLHQWKWMDVRLYVILTKHHNKVWYCAWFNETWGSITNWLHSDSTPQYNCFMLLKCVSGRGEQYIVYSGSQSFCTEYFDLWPSMYSPGQAWEAIRTKQSLQIDLMFLITAQLQSFQQSLTTRKKMLHN